MLNFINSINLLDENKDDKLYDFYKTFSSQANIEIYDKIHKFNSVCDFFDYYTKADSKFLLSSLNEIQSNFSKVINNETPSYYFHSNTDQYISFITKVTFILKLVLLNKKIINKLLLFTKNYFEKYSNENKIENCHHKEISNLINNLLEQSKIIDDIQNSSNLNENKPENSLPETEKCNRRNKKYLSGPVNDMSKSLFRRENEFTFSKNSFKDVIKIIEDENTKKNKKRGYSSTGFVSRKNHNESIDIKRRKSHKHYSDGEKIIENKELFENLLEFTNKLYHHNMINREEKLKLKKLIISRNKKMEEIFVNFEKNEDNSKNRYIQEIRKLIG